MKLRIEKAVYGGDGLARIPQGKTVFVPGTLPGELVEADITEERRSFAKATLATILEASPERVVPGCEYVPRCGGCQYQHATAASQLQMKLDILKETLARSHVAVQGEIGSLAGPPWEYRNRIRLHVSKQVSEETGSALGYRQRASHNLLTVTHCPIAAPLLQRAIHAVTRTGTKLENLCDEVELFTNGEQQQLLVSLWPGRQRPSERSLEDFAERLRAHLPELTGVGLMAPQGMKYWGERSLTYMVCGHAYQVSLGSFFQVNRLLLPQLLQLVVGERSGRMAWDLYSGAGLFAKALAFENVTAVESSGFSADDLQHNLALARRRVVRSSTLDFLRRQAAAGAKPELIVLDPPRAGLDKEICGHLARIAAPALIYVSCDPATLARDLQMLLASGYAIQKINLVDLFPQTFHMETVTVLGLN